MYSRAMGAMRRLLTDIRTYLSPIKDINYFSKKAKVTSSKHKGIL